MKDSYHQQILLLAKRLALSYLLYFICRLLFFFVNAGYFEAVNFWRLLVDCFYGLRFDTFSIIISNCLFIVLSILPLKAFWQAWYQRLLRILFITTNSVFIAVNLVDVAYFPFIKKRSTSELFDQIGGQTDMAKMLPRFLLDFWWLVLVFIVFVYALSYVYRRLRINGSSDSHPVKKSGHVINWIKFAVIVAIAVIGVRGGLQRVPIDIVNAGAATRPEESAIVLNTPFTIIKSMNQTALPEYDFYSEQELKKIYDPIHNYSGGITKHDNVVVLILESFSKEYTKLGGTVSVTPFLDSLMGQSLVFTNAFSNGTKSIEGIPAILSGLPSLMPNPFINSIYANNAQTSFPYLLGKMGYESAFFHGGINGTMNFVDWAALAGYQHYYGKNEYNNDADFDGYWGIWDEPFLQYSIKKMDEMKQPFHSAIFTLSSHHPYFVPEKYKGKFKKTELENSESIGYADYALRVFFEKAKKSAWFNNTLFVLVADHTGISDHKFFKQVVGLSSIPIVFYKADGSLKAENNKCFSQIDILPSVMNYLSYPNKFFAFGSSYKDSTSGNDYLFANGTHYLFEDSMAYCFNAPEITQAFNYKRDSTLQHNVNGQFPQLDQAALRSYKAFLQTYHYALIHNTTRIPN